MNPDGDKTEDWSGFNPDTTQLRGVVCATRAQLESQRQPDYPADWPIFDPAQLEHIIRVTEYIVFRVEQFSQKPGSTTP
jgi:hypothetical protein